MKKRKNLLRQLNKELNIYLKAYDRAHPHYKRNIKSLYEGLIELGILDNPDTPAIFQQFRVAFDKASKDLQKTLIMANLFKESNLGKYFTTPTNKSLNRLKIIGTELMHKQIKEHLSEDKLIKYNNLKTEQEILRKEKEHLRELRQLWKDANKERLKFIKDENLRLKEAYKPLKAGVKLVQKEQKKLDAFYQEFDSLLRASAKNTGIEMPELDQDPVTYRERYDELIKDRLKQIDEGIRTRNISRNTYEQLSEELIQDLKVRSNLTYDDLKNLAKNIAIFRPEVEEKTVKVKTVDIPNLVEPFTNMITLRKQLIKFKEYMDNQRLSLNKPWKIMAYGTDGPDKRASDAPDMPNMGERREGFWQKASLNAISRELGIYNKMIEGFSDALPQGELQTQLYNLFNNIFHLENELDRGVEFFEREINVRSGNQEGREGGTGHITSWEEHPRTIERYHEIRSHIISVIQDTDKSIQILDGHIKHNENLINQAKQGTRTALREIKKLNTFENRLKKIKLSKALNKKEIIEDG